MGSAVDKHAFLWRHILCVVCDYSVLLSVIAWLSCGESVQETSSCLLDPLQLRSPRKLLKSSVSYKPFKHRNGLPQEMLESRSKTARGTRCPVVADKVGSAQRWDSMILKVFSKLMTLWFCIAWEGNLCGLCKAWCAGSGNLCFKISAD